MRLGDYQFDRKKSKRAHTAAVRRSGRAPSGHRVGIKAFVGRFEDGRYWARVCIGGGQWHFKSQRRFVKAVLVNSKSRCSRDMTASTPRRALAKAISSLGVNLRK